MSQAGRKTSTERTWTISESVEKIPEETLLPKSEWFARSMRKHSDVLELRERLRPLHQTATFGRAVNASQTEAKETLSLHNISQLIYQFLKEHRLEKTLKQFQKESKVPYSESELDENALETLLQVGVKDMKEPFTTSSINTSTLTTSSTTNTGSASSLFSALSTNVSASISATSPSVSAPAVLEEEFVPSPLPTAPTAGARTADAALAPLLLTPSMIAAAVSAGFFDQDILYAVDPEVPAPLDYYNNLNAQESQNDDDDADLLDSCFVDNNANRANSCSGTRKYKKFVVSDNGSMLAGTLNCLITALFNLPSATTTAVATSSTIVAETKPLQEKEYRRAFFLTYQSFTTPEKLLNKLIQIYLAKSSNSCAASLIETPRTDSTSFETTNNPEINSSNNSNTNSGNSSRSSSTSGSSSKNSKVISMLKYWLENFPRDWVDKLQLRVILTNFVDNHLLRNSSTTNNGNTSGSSSGSAGSGSSAAATSGTGTGEKKGVVWAKQLRSAISRIEQLAFLATPSPLLDQHHYLYRHSTQQQNPWSSDQQQQQQQNRMPDPKIPKNIFSPTLSLDDVDEEEIARQLTLIDFQLYDRIRVCLTKDHCLPSQVDVASEFLSLAWKRNSMKHRASNLLAAVQRSNTVARWVASSILGESERKKRVKVVARFVKIAKWLWSMNNFAGLAAIYSGFACSAVSRLYHHQQHAASSFSPHLAWLRELPHSVTDVIDDLDLLFSFENSFANYREAYKEAESQALAIPYLGIHLRDIVFIEESIPDLVGSSPAISETENTSTDPADLNPSQATEETDLRVDEESSLSTSGTSSSPLLINFDKRRQLCKIISNVLQYQKSYSILITNNLSDGTSNSSNSSGNSSGGGSGGSNGYPFQYVHQISVLLRDFTIPLLDDKELYERAFTNAILEQQQQQLLDGGSGSTLSLPTLTTSASSSNINNNASNSNSVPASTLT